MVNLGHHPNIGGNTNKTTEDSPRIEQFLKIIREIRARVEATLK